MSQGLPVRLKATSTPAPKTELNPGDMIKVNTSHELKINGDGTWVGYEVMVKVGENETSDEADARARAFLAEKLDHLIQETVDYVMKKG